MFGIYFKRLEGEIATFRELSGKVLSRLNKLENKLQGTIEFKDSKSQSENRLSNDFNEKLEQPYIPEDDELLVEKNNSLIKDSASNNSTRNNQEINKLNSNSNSNKNTERSEIAIEKANINSNRASNEIIKTSSNSREINEDERNKKSQEVVINPPVKITVSKKDSVNKQKKVNF